MTSDRTYRKKLIEVALPLDAINKASILEKTMRHGHPSTLHLWWARRPLATCRAVLFASLVDDPSEHQEEFPTEKEQERERDRLFRLIETVVQWENSNNENVLAQARAEIRKSAGGNPPPVYDPFAGGGSIPLEAQRLGLEVHASDLNPVAVLINKALIEIPPKFADCAPVNPESKKTLMGRDWHGAQGLADDVRYYGKWIRNEAEKRIGHLYPKVTLPKEYGGGRATVIAWLRTHTVKCSNPACGAQMPLVRTFWLSIKKGKEAWIEPEIDHNVTPPSIHFTVKTGKGEPRSGTVNRQGGICIACGAPVPFDYIRAEGKAGRMGAQLMAIVAEGRKERVYLPPNKEHVLLAVQARAESGLDTDLPEQALGFRVQLYGMTKHRDLFTPRQLVALTTLSDLLSEAQERVLLDAIEAKMHNDGTVSHLDSLDEKDYANAIVTYLAFALDKAATTNTSVCAWQTKATRLVAAFSRQAISMIWDYAEANPFSDAAGDYNLAVGSLSEVLDRLSPFTVGAVRQLDAACCTKVITDQLISTDPPYYDNIGYADLSDFFYVWLRRSLNHIYPDLFSTLLVPKSQELIATPFRFGGDKNKARHFFETGLSKAFVHMRESQHADYPLTVYYAFKQSESDPDTEEEEDDNHLVAVASTGWQTMLEGLIQAGFTITGTWPIRTEMVSRSRGLSSNALASSIVLVCRPRPVDAPIASRRQFLNALRAELPAALKNLQHGSIAPVDLAQASIGPGMAIYSRYSKVVESDGSPLRVRTALQLINRALDEALAEQEGEYDAETRWAIAWFEQYAMAAGEYGIAETLSKAKNTSVQSLVDGGFLEAKAGKVRLLKREELAEGWSPKTSRLTAWEVLQRMIHALLNGNGEIGAGDILRQASSQGEGARDLAYRLYTVCERKGWAQEALAYNSLVTSWSEISRLAHRLAGDGNVQQAMLLG